MKFNTKTKGTSQVLNHEGETAYKLEAKLELYSLVVTSALNNKFYESDKQQLERLRTLIGQVNPEFVVKLAIYAREKMYLRSIPLVLAVELAKVHNGDNLVSKMVSRIVQRADEITELLAYYQFANERQGIKKLNKLSKQLQKGLAQAFNRFDEYQFAKYNRDTEVRLRDALFLVHPQAKDKEQQELFNKIVEDTLETPYTWEVELSLLGQQYKDETEKVKALKEKWEELITSGKLGYMALMRNLRNILQANIDRRILKEVATRLSDERQVRRSKQLPFRFLSAYRELVLLKSNQMQILLKALEEAICASVENLKGFDENTDVLVACDTSGSMCSAISPRSKVMYYDVGLVLGMLLQSKAESVMSGIFGDTWKVINLPKDNILSNADNLRKRMGEVGYSTNGYLIIKDLIQRKHILDKVMIFTDCQLWNSNYSGESIADLWKQYKKIAPHAKIYLFDLAGYGQSPLNVQENDVYLIAGWSDKIFEVIEAIENGGNSLEEVEKIEI